MRKSDELKECGIPEPVWQPLPVRRRGAAFCGLSGSRRDRGNGLQVFQRPEEHETLTAQTVHSQKLIQGLQGLPHPQAALMDLGPPEGAGSIALLQKPDDQRVQPLPGAQRMLGLQREIAQTGQGCIHKIQTDVRHSQDEQVPDDGLARDDAQELQCPF